MKEGEFIEWIRRQGGLDPARVPLGPGDDAAVVACGREHIVLTADQLLDGVHFVFAEHGAEAVGRKAMARNLSDVAAMAALPLAALATVALPAGFSRADAEALYRGLRSAGDAFDCPLAGGDVGAWAGPLAVSVTVLARPAGVRTVCRAGAEPGDALCVTGAFGGAWRRQRHLRFTPRVREARALAEGFDLHAMIDVSDGLAADLDHLCRASGVGAEVRADAVPVHADAALAAPQRTPLQAALADGEDYELLFALPAGQARRLADRPPCGTPVTCIGRVVAAQELVLIQPDGRREALAPSGWEHRT